jgi:Na+-driven multidrug efflux pump
VWGPLIILAVSMFPVRLGLALGLDPVWGADALWWSFPLGSIVNIVLAVLYYLYGPWRRGRLLVPEEHVEERSHADIEPGNNLKPAS